MENESKRKSKGGRKKVSPSLLQDHQLKIFVTEEEFNLVNEEFRVSGYRSRSEFLKVKLFHSKQGGSVINPLEILGQIDKIGTELSKIGSNMNQIAKYANSLSLRREINVHPIRQFNKLMDDYMAVRRDLVKAYRALIKSF